VFHLYEKTEANPEKSLAGCLVATAAMMGVVAVLALAEGGAFIGGRGDYAKMLMAERGVEEVREAVQAVLADAGVATVAQLFDPAATEGADATVQRCCDWFADVLERGHGADVPLRPEIRERLKAQYLRPAHDPWGRPYCVSEGEALQVYSRGRTPAPEHTADDIWSGSTEQAWRGYYRPE
jgi:hypothetical protein